MGAPLWYHILPFLLLTIPKEPYTYHPLVLPRDPIPSSPYTPSTRERHLYTQVIKELGVKIGFYYERYKKENLWYFVSTSLGECTRYIAIYSLYSLFILKDK